MPLQEEEGDRLNENARGGHGAEGGQLRFRGLHRIQGEGQLRLCAGFTDRAFLFVAQGLHPAFAAHAPHMERPDLQRPDRIRGLPAAADTLLFHLYIPFGLQNRREQASCPRQIQVYRKRGLHHNEL